MTDKIRPELVERMTADGQRGHLSRRDFIRFAVASGMTVAGASARRDAISAAAVACTASSWDRASSQRQPAPSG